MKILTVVGKTDSRSIVYPLARALSINGLTGIVTDDGAYRRLYHGKGNIGTVNGIDISVVNHVDESAVHSLDNMGIPYDYLIIVSSDYIYPESNGVIICHGLDRSILVVDDAEEEDEFIIPKLVEEPKQESVVKKKSGMFGKSKSSPVVSESTEVPDAVEIPDEVLEEEPVVVEESAHDKLVRLQNENPDKIIVPDDMKFTEAQIAFVAAPKGSMIGITLKEGILTYVYGCEDEKRLKVFFDKAFNSALIKLSADLLDIPAKEMGILLTKEEGKGTLEDGKKKKK